MRRPFILLSSAHAVNPLRSAILVLFFLTFCLSQAQAQKGEREIYEVRIYKLKDKSQQERVDKFLKEALLPALHRAGIKKIGVFKLVETDTLSTKRIILLIPYASLDKFSKTNELIAADKQLNVDGKDYADAVYTSPAFMRTESILLQAFPGMTKMIAPTFATAPGERVYEMRSYESASEKIYRNKVQMFNAGGEIDIFNRLGFNAVFYADVIVGGSMPNLMYMTTFENLASREAHWKAFRDDAAWVKLKAMPEYQNNVSKSTIYLMHPTEYSDY